MTTPSREKGVALDLEKDAEVEPIKVKCYADYLGAILTEGDGRISAEQYASLEALKLKYSVPHETHLATLTKLGWTEERFRKARDELPSEYVTFLQAILVDGVIEDNEAKTLRDLKKKHDLSDEDHRRALNTLGYTERDYLVACAKGANSRTVQRFGRSTSKIIEGDTDKEEYCRGLFVSPYVHQWWETRDGERVMVRAPGSDTRASTSLEAFYDLVVVAVVDRIVHAFAEDNTRWFPFIVLFFCIWRVWASTMFYNTLWDAGDLTTKLVMFVQMFGLVWMAISAEDAFDGVGLNGFAIGYVLALTPLLIFYLWAALRGQRGQGWATIQIFTVSFSPAVILLSLLLHGKLEGNGFLGIWLFAVLLPEVLPVLATLIPGLGKHRMPLNIEHVTERYSVFILIVLGETITSLMVDLPWDSNEVIWQLFVSIGAGLATSFAIKWLYFDVDEEKRRHPFRRQALHGIVWSVGHAPLCLAIATSAAGFFGIQSLIIEYVEKEVLHRNATIPPPDSLAQVLSNEGPIPSPSNPENLPSLLKGHDILFCVGLGGALLFLTMQSLVAKHHKHYIVPAKVRVSIRFLVAISIGLLPFGTYGMGGLPLVMIAAAIIVALALFEMIAMLPGEHAESLEDLDEAPLDVLRVFVLRHFPDSVGVSLDPEEPKRDEKKKSHSINETASKEFERFTDKE